MNRQQNILVLTYWSFEDALIQTYTLPYVKIISKNLPKGSKIYLLTAEKSKPQYPSLSEFNIELVSMKYVPFGLRAALSWVKNIFILYKLIKNKNISVIHAWCTPAGMLGYILSVLTRRKLIVDSFEPHAEAMVENGEWNRKSSAFMILFLFERLQAKRATYLIAASEGMKLYSQKKYGHNKDNFYVKPACVDLRLFSEKNCKKTTSLVEFGFENKIVAVYSGKFGGIYLDNEVFALLKVAETYWKGNFRALILSAQPPNLVRKMAATAGLSPDTIVHKFVSHDQIPDYIGLADFGLTLVKPVPTKKYCTPIKDGEYWALGLPILITPNISDDSEIIQRYKIGSVLKGLDQECYLQSIKEIDALLKNNTRSELYIKIRAIAEKYRNFEIAENIYRKIYGNA